MRAHRLISDDNPAPYHDLIEWVDVAFVLERYHRNKPTTRFPDAFKAKRLVVPGMPDKHASTDPELARILTSRRSRGPRCTGQSSSRPLPRHSRRYSGR